MDWTIDFNFLAIYILWFEYNACYSNQSACTAIVIGSAVVDADLSMNMDSKPLEYVLSFSEKTMKEMLNERLHWVTKASVRQDMTSGL